MMIRPGKKDESEVAGLEKIAFLHFLIEQSRDSVGKYELTLEGSCHPHLLSVGHALDSTNEVVTALGIHHDDPAATCVILTKKVAP